MKSKETDILKVLIEKNEELNISKISKYSKIGYKNTYQILKRLNKKNLVKFETFGRNKKCILNIKANPLIFETEFARSKKLLSKNKNLKVLFNKLKGLEFPFLALIFGSYAKGKAAKHSDIDILTVSEDKRKRNINEIFQMFPMDFHLTQINFEEFCTMLKSKEFSVVSEAVKYNVILLGIETYYLLLENAERKKSKGS